MGLEPAQSRSNGLRDEIAIEKIYNGNRKLYETHKSMSEGFEHGFGRFSVIRTSFDEIVNEVLGLVRIALLKQLDLPVEILQPLMSDEYHHPLGGWLPRIHVTGTWTLKAAGCNLEEFLSAQKLEQSKPGSVCFTDLSLNSDSSEIRGVNQSTHPADILYTGSSILMPSDGRSKIASVDITHSVNSNEKEN